MIRRILNEIEMGEFSYNFKVKNALIRVKGNISEDKLTITIR